MGLISKCFESHLDIFIGAQDKNISELLEEFIEETKRKETKNIVSCLDTNKTIGMSVVLRNYTICLVFPPRGWNCNFVDPILWMFSYC